MVLPLVVSVLGVFDVAPVCVAVVDPAAVGALFVLIAVPNTPGSDDGSVDADVEGVVPVPVAAGDVEGVTVVVVVAVLVGVAEEFVVPALLMLEPGPVTAEVVESAAGVADELPVDDADASGLTMTLGAGGATGLPELKSASKITVMPLALEGPSADLIL